MTLVQATLKRIDPTVEEEVELDINGTVITAFATVCPFSIQVGRVYLVELSLFLLDDPDCQLASDGVAPGVYQSATSYFQATVVGTLEQGGISVNGAILHSDEYDEFHEFLGRLVQSRVDRVDAVFCQAVDE